MLSSALLVAGSRDELRALKSEVSMELGKLRAIEAAKK